MQNALCQHKQNIRSRDQRQQRRGDNKFDELHSVRIWAIRDGRFLFIGFNGSVRSQSGLRCGYLTRSRCLSRRIVVGLMWFNWQIFDTEVE